MPMDLVGRYGKMDYEETGWSLLVRFGRNTGMETRIVKDAELISNPYVYAGYDYRIRGTQYEYQALSSLREVEIGEIIGGENNKFSFEEL